MFDAVINHVSTQSDWFQAFLRDEPAYRDYFKVVARGTDLSRVFRPRALPLLTAFATTAGEKLVWTTFSDDQADLNYENPAVLLDVIDTMLFYVARGADLLRLDAVAFLWKEAGTRSLHLPQTHRVIRLLRAVLDQVAPHVVLITETNVPHEENVSYFGDGTSEAQMVYNFSLPPLVLHAIHTGSAEALSSWASTLSAPSAETTFFNFLASHDGIGVTPARGILGDDAVAALAGRVTALGGYVSTKNNADGSQSAYELNINYLDALGDPAHRDEESAFVARRFLAAQAIMLALQGVPGIYFHSLFGSRGWPGGVAETGRYRTINRQKLQRETLERELGKPGSLRALVFEGYRRLLSARAQEPAFHPQAPQQVLSVDQALFALLRGKRDDIAQLLCLHNVSARPVTASLGASQRPTGDTFYDVIGGARFALTQGKLTVTLAPYEVLWLAGGDRITSP
jgi:sucrose phosphorylase